MVGKGEVLRLPQVERDQAQSCSTSGRGVDKDRRRWSVKVQSLFSEEKVSRRVAVRCEREITVESTEARCDVDST